MSSLEVNRGNTKNYTLTITENGESKNIEGYTLRFTVKKNTNDLVTEDIGALISKTIDTTSEVGIASISLTSEDTLLNPGVYFYDIKLRNPSGSWVKSTTPDKFVVGGVVTNG